MYMADDKKVEAHATTPKTTDAPKGTADQKKS